MDYGPLTTDYYDTDYREWAWKSERFFWPPVFDLKRRGRGVAECRRVEARSFFGSWNFFLFSSAHSRFNYPLSDRLANHIGQVQLTWGEQR